MDKPKLNEEDLKMMLTIDESSFNGELNEEDRKKLVEQREENRKKLVEQREENRKKHIEDGHCLNCNAYNGKDYKYCQFCGTKRGEGEFNPLRNNGLDILLYGPTDLCYFKCKKCGHKWHTYIMYIGEDTPIVKFCPKCGQKRIGMYYSEDELAGVRQTITFNDMLKYKIRKLKNFVYNIKRKIRSIFSKNGER